MTINFKVYKRKIHLWMKTPNGVLYAWSTNAYKTCKAAVTGAKIKRPQLEFVARFAKD